MSYWKDRERKVFRLFLGLLGVIFILLVAVYLFLAIVKAFLREQEEIERKYFEDTEYNKRR